MGIFDNFNQQMGKLGLSGNLGLLTTGAGLLEGQSPLQAVQAGLNVYGSMTEDEERRRKRAALAKLGEQYAGDPRLKAIIDADPEAGLSLISRLEAQRRAPKSPTLLSQRQQLATALGFEAGSDEYNRVLQTGSASPAARATAKDADGFLRYTDTQERVFPGAKGKTEKPTLTTVGGALYNVTDPTNPVLVVPAKDDPKTAMIGDKLYNITDINNPTVIVDETKPPKPVLTNVGGALYNVTDPSNPVLVVPAKNDPKTAVIGGDLFDITDINNPTLVVKAEDTPASPNVRDYISDKAVTINGVTYPAGKPFPVNLNDPDALGAVLEAGAVQAPTKTQQTITNTSDADINKTITELTEQAGENELDIDITNAAGGDIGGVVTDAVNAVAGLFGTSFDPSRQEAQATVEAANNSIREPLVKALSRSGSVYTQKQIANLLPSSRDNNQDFIEKANALIPTLENELRIQASIMNTSNDLTERTAAEGSAKALVKYIESMKTAIAVYGRSGEAQTSFSAADAILKKSKKDEEE